MKIAFVCMLMSNFGVDFSRYIFSNISVNIESTCIHLMKKKKKEKTLFRDGNHVTFE